LRIAILIALAALATAAGSRPARAQGLPPLRRGATVNIEPTSGRTFYHEPGQARTPLTTEVQVPVNTIVDASNGQMGLTSTDGAADLHGGAFVIRQPSTEHVTQLFLAGGHPSQCQAGSAAVVRELWGDGKGRFQTPGRYAAATVRGTTWLVQDRCDGTLTKVTKGVVAVRDFRLRRTILVRAGQTYLARK